MAIVDGSALGTRPSNPFYHQPQLFSLISVLCAPHDSPPDSDRCRLIVDGRLPWAVAPADAQSSWLYLPQAARWRRIADCWVLTAD